MLEVILDTETTGLSIAEKHRIVEIGCVELDNQIPTNKIFHEYINPERAVSEEAYKIHGYSDEFLLDKKTFSEISEDFLNFIKDKKIIMHNASFDLSFLNHELKFINKKIIDKKNVIDTLELARSKHPGSQNSLDALCKRFNIDNSKREKHSALVDCYLLKEVYVNLLDQKEPKLDLKSGGVADLKFSYNTRKNNNMLRKIVKLSDDELKLHKKYLQSQLPKNNYN
jgi:DNA polymerase-3 subunit epsilon